MVMEVVVNACDWFTGGFTFYFLINNLYYEVYHLKLCML